MFYEAYIFGIPATRLLSNFLELFHITEFLRRRKIDKSCKKKYVLSWRMNCCLRIRLQFWHFYRYWKCIAFQYVIYRTVFVKQWDIDLKLHRIPGSVCVNHEASFSVIHLYLSLFVKLCRGKVSLTACSLQENTTYVITSQYTESISNGGRKVQQDCLNGGGIVDGNLVTVGQLKK